MADHPLPHAEQVQRELDALVAQGLLLRRQRDDGRIGYWATPEGLAALREPRGPQTPGSG
jgi:hypothetical protein